MRWQRLFADLEAQAEAADAAELAAEVADRTRREAALLGLADRLRAAVGAEVVVTLPGAQVVRGRLVDCGAQWLLVEEAAGRQALVASSAVLGVTGAGGVAAPPGSEGEVARRLDLRWCLRGLARDRAGVLLVLVDGSSVSGTIDRVGSDHLDLAEHPAGEARRRDAVRQVRLVPLSAVALVRSS